MNAGAPALEDVLETATSPGTFFAAMYASGWLVRHSLAPTWARDVLTVALVAAPLVTVVLLARAFGLSLERGRCWARTNAGDRCTREAAGISADLCWQHQDLADVELVDDYCREPADLDEQRDDQGADQEGSGLEETAANP